MPPHGSRPQRLPLHERRAATPPRAAFCKNYRAAARERRRSGRSMRPWRHGAAGGPPAENSMMTKAQARGIAASRDISWLSGCLHSTGRHKTKFLACVKSFTRNFGGMHDIAREVGTFNHPVFANHLHTENTDVRSCQGRSH